MSATIVSEAIGVSNRSVHIAYTASLDEKGIYTLERRRTTPRTKRRYARTFDEVLAEAASPDEFCAEILRRAQRRPDYLHADAIQRIADEIKSQVIAKARAKVEAGRAKMAAARAAAGKGQP